MGAGGQEVDEKGPLAAPGLLVLRGRYLPGATADNL